MKPIIIMYLLVGTIIPLTMNGQDMADNSGYKTFASSANLDYTDRLAESDLYLYSGNIKIQDRCKKYTNLKEVGTVMTVVGVLSFVVGIIAFNNAEAEDSFLFSTQESLGLLGMGAGIGLTGAGVPIMVVGIVKSNQYCGKDGSAPRLILKSSGNGAGLALTF